MTNRRAVTAGLAAFAMGGAARAQEAGALSGVWSARLDIGPGQSLRLKLEISADGAAQLFSLDQGASAIPVSLKSVDPNKIIWEAPSLGARFVGTLRGDALSGTFTQGRGRPLHFVRGEGALAQAPVPPLTIEKLESLRAEAGSPAMIAASNAGFAAATGRRRVDDPTPVTIDDAWHIGSCTKSMTATLVARLVEQGAVGWDDQVGSILGPFMPDMNEAYKSVTFKHLLSHRSGLQANIGMLDFMRFKRVNPAPQEERRAFARKALSMTPKGPKETTAEYSNNGYVVAGAMLETRLGKSWEDLMRMHVFAPLGMTGAGFGAPGTADALTQPVGHTKGVFGERRDPYPIGKGVTDNPVALGPAGIVHARADDMLKYLGAHLERSAFLKPESWDQLHTPPFGGDYAMGWVVRADGALWHNGSNTLWYAEMAFHRGKGRAAFAAANDGHLPKSQPAIGAALSGLLV
jgi:CubicO group peptidase (beta-lactamase class C family)